MEAAFPLKGGCRVSDRGLRSKAQLAAQWGPLAGSNPPPERGSGGWIAMALLRAPGGERDGANLQFVVEPVGPAGGLKSSP